MMTVPILSGPRFLPRIGNKFHGFFKRYQHHINANMLEVDLCKGQGSRVWDKNGKEYLDFYGQNGSVNAGHCHPKLVQCIQEQVCQLHQATRSLHNNVTPEFCSTICQMFNYDRVMVHNTETGKSDGVVMREMNTKVSIAMSVIIQKSFEMIIKRLNDLSNLKKQTNR